MRTIDHLRYAKFRPKQHDKLKVTSEVMQLHRVLFDNPTEQTAANMLRDELMECGYSRRSAIALVHYEKRRGLRRKAAELLVEGSIRGEQARMLVLEYVGIYVLGDYPPSQVKFRAAVGGSSPYYNRDGIYFVGANWLFAQMDKQPK